MNRSLSGFLERFKKDLEALDHGSAGSVDDCLYDEELNMGRAADRLDQQIVSFFGDDFDDDGCQLNLDEHVDLDHVISASSNMEAGNGPSPSSKALSAISVLYGDDGFPVVRSDQPASTPNLDTEQDSTPFTRFLQRAQSDAGVTRCPRSPQSRQSPRSRPRSRSRTRSHSLTTKPRRHSCDVNISTRAKHVEHNRAVQTMDKTSSHTHDSSNTATQRSGFPTEEDMPELAVKVASFDFVVETTASGANDEDEEVPSTEDDVPLSRQPPVSPPGQRARGRSSTRSTPRSVPRTTTLRSTTVRSASRSTPRSTSRSASQSASRSAPRSASRSASRSTPRSVTCTPTLARENASCPPPVPKIEVPVPSDPIIVELRGAADQKSKRRSAPSSSSNKRPTTQKHIRWCGHGVRWTAVALMAAIVGSIFAILAQRSTAFVRLGTPMDVAPIYQEVDTIGMFRMEVCFNETFSAADQTGCQIFPLTSRDISDNMFDLSRVFLTLATLFGCFFTLFLISAMFWESINLKPIGLGFLAIYFFQSFSMLFFDTEICSGHTCKLGPGCAFCIGASLSWIVACVSVVKMDNFKIRANRRRRRAARRARREERRRRAKAKELERKKYSSAPLTTRTVATLSTTSTDESSGTAPTSDLFDMTPLAEHPDDGMTYEC